MTFSRPSLFYVDKIKDVESKRHFSMMFIASNEHIHRVGVPIYLVIK